LLNRVFTGDPAFPVGDFPGTLAVRRDTFLRSGAYDGDALFENLELMRTIRAAGGTIVSPLDLYVARRPPDTAHFLSQRVRQAYDDFAIPARFVTFLALPPLAGRGGARLGRRRRVRALPSRRPPALLTQQLVAGAGVDRRALALLLGGAGRTSRRWSPLRGSSPAARGDVAAPPEAPLLRGLDRRRLRGQATLGAKPDGLVSPVAERADTRAPAAAERNYRAFELDLVTVLVNDRHRPPD
jgi:hypothetical protein